MLVGALALLLTAGCGGGSDSAATAQPGASTAAASAPQPTPPAPADPGTLPASPSPSPTDTAPPSAPGNPATPTTRTPGASPTAKPASAGGAWPNASNTGYKNAPGYPGSLTTFKGTLESNHTYKFMRFTNELFVGTSDVTLHNITFYGCLFESNNIVDTTVAVYSENVVFDYSTFAPSKASAPPVSYNNGYQYAIDVRRDVQLTVDHSDIWGFGNGIQIGFSSKAKPFVVRNTWFHDARSDGGVDHTDAILCSDGGPTFMVIDHNTISSVGNTNGLAFQVADVYYTDVSVTNNYFSGFGYTVNMGGNGKGNQRITFTGNTFGTDLKPMWGPLYGWGGTNVTWRNNKWHVAPGGYDKQQSNDGKFWWPDGTLSAKDYNG
ncbi:hypothetical protein [Yinghuangia seranimata]|uniref:hypothetical protein n=1 Tax=Yinghuangia seranimata TaxID=408067 RepID=UPI00248CEC04|nr:hypothetical protein [Yinghuangia seranimata]MDI2128457.1 hypothetical protein [Yinghuangia seranimata]